MQQEGPEPVMNEAVRTRTDYEDQEGRFSQELELIFTSARFHASNALRLSNGKARQNYRVCRDVPVCC
jgi:hypothetical protein